MGRWHQAEPFKAKASKRNPEPLEKDNDETTALESVIYQQVSCRNLVISRFT
jgi:hypothetical protein